MRAVPVAFLELISALHSQLDSQSAFGLGKGCEARGAFASNRLAIGADDDTPPT
jgi:hypothetical protein